MAPAEYERERCRLVGCSGLLGASGGAAVVALTLFVFPPAGGGRTSGRLVSIHFRAAADEKLSECAAKHDVVLDSESERGRSIQGRYSSRLAVPFPQSSQFAALRYGAVTMTIC
jgi:hypothetical protein